MHRMKSTIKKQSQSISAAKTDFLKTGTPCKVETASRKFNNFNILQPDDIMYFTESKNASFSNDTTPASSNSLPPRRSGVPFFFENDKYIPFLVLAAREEAAVTATDDGNRPLTRTGNVSNFVGPELMYRLLRRSRIYSRSSAIGPPGSVSRKI